MIDPNRKSVRGRSVVNTLGAAAAISKDGVTVDQKDGQAPIFVPADLVETLTGQKMPPAQPLRCKRVNPKRDARRKQAKASRKRNR